MKKTVIGFSGGMDSTTLLGLLIDQEEENEIHCCIFNYGSTHNKYENLAANNVINYYQRHKKQGCTKIYKHPFDITSIMTEFSSNLLLSSKKEIPEGPYDDGNMQKTVVQGRNLIFASIMAGLAESIGAQKIALGIHQGEHYIYPDCRIEFAKALDTLIYLSTDRKVEVFCPFIKDDKLTILKKGYSFKIPVPYHLTRTCYKNQVRSCGKCGSCTERLAAFKQTKCIDPIDYEEY
ncbi:MAG: 7-cyano-7-deazaguanine synthase QueC [Sphaerochaetaceae bacterium]